MIRKFWSVVCDVKGCQAYLAPSRTRVQAQKAAQDSGWLQYLDARRKPRAVCPTHVSRANGNRSPCS